MRRRAATGVLLGALAFSAPLAAQQDAGAPCGDGSEDPAALSRQAMSLLPRGGASAQRSATEAARRLLRRGRRWGATVH
ncbi:MAG TPA: hypothetical protein VH854_10775, partial [Thermoanaerobaculia bacterium]|nr:hypothetical protein [Thermoanaerobaculia bacterium]